ncbi:cation:proton antiporter [Mangrovibacterium lignilyticum]|uniref:cation:proton antiporter n=1 Tax=Mangrovibacterium lignilyticum TaxID=2668052 RepID=UPI0013D167D0|nr:cation:proton antiporter [Mangrovibacterium lignilyticum]
MNIVLSVGVLIFVGFILGELAKKAKLPKISGYILAGILLNPDLLGIMSPEFVDHTDPLLTISLSVITFSIGGSLSLSKIKATGRTILLLTLYEALFAFFLVLLCMSVTLYFFMSTLYSLPVILALSLVLASLASPTDPSATLAVIHEYDAKGAVSSSMLEIAAFDDVIGITIFTLASAGAAYLMGESSATFVQIVTGLGKGIGGAVLLGGLGGLLFNFLVKLFRKESDGSLIVITFGMVLLTYGLSDYFGFEALLATMSLGVIVVNYNSLADKIFQLIERYTDELIFVVFFSLSGLHLQLSALSGSFLLILIYILARAAGKFLGIFAGAVQFKADPKVKRYAAGGLIPQGGIVIGLALLQAKDPAFKDISSLIIGVVIGAALIHEIIGPVMSRLSLKKAGEI